MKKKSLSARLFALLLAGLLTSGCSAQPSTDASEPAASDAPSSQSEASGNYNASGLPIFREPETFTVAVKKRSLSKNSYAEKECTLETEKATNIKIEWTEIPESGWGEKINIMFASGDLPDAILGGVDVVKNLDSLARLDPYFNEESTPAILQIFEDYPEVRKALETEDGGIYSLTTGNYGFWLSMGDIFYINQKWLNALNLPMPETTEEFYEVLKAFKDQDPNGNGTADEIPFTFVGAEDLYPMMGAFGITEDKNHVQVRNDKVEFTADQDAYLEALRYLNRLYTEGLLDVEAFSQTTDQMVAKGKNAEPILGSFCEYLNDVVASNYDDFAVLTPLRGPDGAQLMPKPITNPGNTSGFVITKNCRQPEALVRWYDYCNSTFDIRMLWGFGPENTSWKFDESGKWTSTNDNLPEGMAWGEYRHTVSGGSVAPVFGIDETPELKIFNERDERRNDAVLTYLEYVPEQNLPAGFESLEVKEARDILYTDIDSYIKNFVATSIINGISDEQWQEHLNKCKTLKTDEYAALWQKTYDAKK